MSATINNWPEAAVIIVAIIAGAVCICVFLWGASR